MRGTMMRIERLKRKEHLVIWQLLLYQLINIGWLLKSNKSVRQCHTHITLQLLLVLCSTCHLMYTASDDWYLPPTPSSTCSTYLFPYSVMASLALLLFEYLFCSVEPWRVFIAFTAHSRLDSLGSIPTCSTTANKCFSIGWYGKTLDYIQWLFQFLTSNVSRPSFLGNHGLIVWSSLQLDWQFSHRPKRTKPDDQMHHGKFETRQSSHKS